MRKILLLVLVLFFTVPLQAQELKCNVQVRHEGVQGSNKQVYETLRNAIFEFMNNRVWTEHVYTMDERIECNISFNITEQISADDFRGTLQIQMSRPVFNTNYKTTLFNFVDNDIRFRYIEFEPLEFDLNSHSSNLTSILAFYAYFLLGLDYDTFSYMGGSPYFENAEKIVLNANNVPEKGWRPVDNMSHKNRYWLVKDFLDQDYAPIREFNYRYHRHGLDVMDSKQIEGRAEIATSIELLQKVHRARPDPYMYILRLVFDAKADEMSKVFSESFPEEKNRVYNILTEMDQTNEAKYKSILESPTNQLEF
jgi:hypothetical protein